MVIVRALEDRLLREQEEERQREEARRQAASFRAWMDMGDRPLRAFMEMAPSVPTPGQLNPIGRQYEAERAEDPSIRPSSWTAPAPPPPPAPSAFGLRPPTVAPAPPDPLQELAAGFAPPVRPPMLPDLQAGARGAREFAQSIQGMPLPDVASLMGLADVAGQMGTTPQALAAQPQPTEFEREALRQRVETAALPALQQLAPSPGALQTGAALALTPLAGGPPGANPLERVGRIPFVGPPLQRELEFLTSPAGLLTGGLMPAATAAGAVGGIVTGTPAEAAADAGMLPGWAPLAAQAAGNIAPVSLFTAPGRAALQTGREALRRAPQEIAEEVAPGAARELAPAARAAGEVAERSERGLLSVPRERGFTFVSGPRDEAALLQLDGIDLTATVRDAEPRLVEISIGPGPERQAGVGPAPTLAEMGRLRQTIVGIADANPGKELIAFADNPKVRQLLLRLGAEETRGVGGRRLTIPVERLRREAPARAAGELGVIGEDATRASDDFVRRLEDAGAISEEANLEASILTPDGRMVGMSVDHANAIRLAGFDDFDEALNSGFTMFKARGDTAPRQLGVAALDERGLARTLRAAIDQYGISADDVVYFDLGVGSSKVHAPPGGISVDSALRGHTGQGQAAQLRAAPLRSATPLRGRPRELSVREKVRALDREAAQAIPEGNGASRLADEAPEVVTARERVVQAERAGTLDAGAKEALGEAEETARAQAIRQADEAVTGDIEDIVRRADEACERI